MIHRRDFVKASAAAALCSLARSGYAQEIGLAPQRPVSFDERSVLLNGRRMLLACGEIHYPRSTRAMWPTLLERSKSLGLNSVATYVFWNVHETSRGVYDFSGDRDLGHYLDLCQHNGLAVFLRVGPYICAEWNYGGYPPYLRDEPGIVIRTMSKPYTDRVQAFLERLAEVVRPRLASNGGPIILVQVENEYANVAKRYGDAGQEYLRWIVELAQRLGYASVPTTTCEGGAQGAIETSNGFIIPPARIAKVRQSHPGTPLLWTELYPSWYRVWGGRNTPGRDVRSIAGGVLDFISRGGSGFNYYPWHGGSNFGRTSMYLQTTSYDYSAPLDEFGAITASGVCLGRLHAVLHEHTSLLLEGDRSENTAGSQRTTTWRLGQDELHLVQNEVQEPSPGQDFIAFMNWNAQASLVNAKGETLFDTNAAHEAVARSFVASTWKPVTQAHAEPLQWLSFDEPMPADRRDAGIVSLEPVEQLSLTKDATDYCWFSTVVQVDDDGPQEILIPYGADFFYLFVDDRLVATSRLPLSEDRGAITPDDPAHPRVVANVSEVGHEHGFQHRFTLPTLTAGAHRIDLLSTALGMIKGDWQIASPMNFERKGIWQGVFLNGTPVRNWTMRSGLIGEKQNLYAGQPHPRWNSPNQPRPLRWYKTEIRIPADVLKTNAVFRLDAAGLGKGMIWVNGNAVGRHWLIAASNPSGALSQRYYHVPAGWLRASNRIVIFEEQAASPSSAQLEMRT